MTTRYVCEDHAPEMAPGGWWQCIEIAGAYAGGGSRHDRVFVEGRLGDAPEQRAIAIMEAHDTLEASRERVNGPAELRGLDLDDFKARTSKDVDPGEALAAAKRKAEWAQIDPVEVSPDAGGKG